MHISYEKRRLSNGLDVLVHEDRHVPIVAVNVWYHVGSKNEQPGRTGFAHLFEHLMFEGSAHYDHGFFPPLQEAGASLNGSTNADRTNYWEVVPLGALDLALWMESDRMGFLLPALTQAKFDNQRDVVLNERRQNYENRPYGFALMALTRALYPDGHPYSWLTIGETDDLRAARLDDVQAFLQTYYHPANASLALAGDIDTEQAFELAERYFGDLAPGPHVEPVSAPPSALAREQRCMIEDKVEFPRIYLAWHSPRLFEPGDAELDLLGDILANGKTSRLYRELVFTRRVALDVAAYQNSRELSGFFLITATAAPGHSLEEIDALIRAELDTFCEVGPTASELERGRVQAEAQFVHRLQTVGGFNGKSDQLNAYNVFLGDPGYFGRDLQRYRDVEAAELREAARRFLRDAPRVALSVVPRGGAHAPLHDSIPVSVA